MLPPDVEAGNCFHEFSPNDWCGGEEIQPYHDPYHTDFDHYFEKENPMTKKTVSNTINPIDPLAGLPVAAPKAAPAPSGNVVNLSTHKKKRLTGQAYKDARDFARKATGYDSSSPIWGKRLPTVLTEIEATLEKAGEEADTGNLIEALDGIRAALELNRELQKRVATGQLISAQS